MSFAMRRAAPHVGRVEGGFDIEARLAELARARGPLRRVFAAVAGAMLERRGYERLGYARVGDYARERLGLSGRVLQELAQVDAKLAGLPRLEQALVAGALPWSKVRLLTRFVTADDEERWIVFARDHSCRVLEKRLRSVDRGALGGVESTEEADGVGKTETVRLRVPMKAAFKWHRTCRDAAKVAGERVTPAIVLEMVTAEMASVLPVESEALPDEAPNGCAPQHVCEAGAAAYVCATHGVREEQSGFENVIGRETPAFLAPHLEGLDAADPFELDARLRRVVRLEQRLDAEIAPLLRHVMSRDFEWTLERAPGLAAFARERLGMSPRKAHALLRLERVGDCCPDLREAWRDGKVTWVQAQHLARLVEGGEAENRAVPAWVAWAQSVSVRRLEEVVAGVLVWREACWQDWMAFGDDPERVAAAAGVALGGSGEVSDECGEGALQTCARPTDSGRDVQIRVIAPRDVARLFRASLCTVRRAIERQTGKLPHESEAFDAMLDHALQSWGVTDPWLRRESRRRYRIFERDGWRCTVPGCTSQRNLHEHHIRFRSAGGSNEPENRTTLCAFHHQRGVHAGTLRISGRAPADLWFELGTREGRPPLVRYRSGDRVA